MRDDMLIFPSQPLARDLQITGPIVVHLFAAKLIESSQAGQPVEAQ